MKKILVRESTNAKDIIVAFDINSKRQTRYGIDYDTLVVNKVTMEHYKAVHSDDCLKRYGKTYLSAQSEGVQNYIEIWRDDWRDEGKVPPFECISYITMFAHVMGLALAADLKNGNTQHQRLIGGWAYRRWMKNVPEQEAHLLVYDLISHKLIA